MNKKPKKSETVLHGCSKIWKLSGIRSAMASYGQLLPSDDVDHDVDDDGDWQVDATGHQH